MDFYICNNCKSLVKVDIYCNYSCHKADNSNTNLYCLKCVSCSVEQARLQHYSVHIEVASSVPLLSLEMAVEVSGECSSCVRSCVFFER